MKQNSILLFCLGLLFSLILPAQKVNIKWSEEEELKELHLGKALGQYEGVLCTIGNENNREQNLDDEDLFLRWYDLKNLKVLKQTMIESGQEYKKEELFYLGSSFYRDTALIFFTAENGKSKKDADYLGLRRVSRDGTVSPFTVITQFNVNWDKDITYHLLQSEDHSKLAWVVELQNKYKETISLQCVVMDETGQLQWEQVLDLPSTKDKKFMVEDLQLSNKGDIFFIGHLAYLNAGMEKDANGPSREHQITRLSNGGLVTKEIIKPGAYLAKGKLRLNENTQTAQAIFLYSPSSYEAFGGYFMAYTDMDQMAIKSHRGDFGRNGFASQEDEPGLVAILTKKVETGLIIREVFSHSNGDLSVLFEEAGTVTTNSGGVVSTTHYRFYGFVVQLNRLGELKRIVPIPKRNASSIAEGAMYYPFLYEDKVHLLYLEDPTTSENLRKKEPITSGGGYKVRTVISEVTSDGNVNRVEMETNEDKTKNLYPGYSHYLGDGQLMLHAFYWRDGRIGLLNIR